MRSECDSGSSAFPAAAMLWIALSFVAACIDDPPQGLAALSSNPSYAVTLSDRSSTAIALLDERGEVIDPAWIHSGTTVPGLVAALSGDVVLPSTSGPRGELMLIDRFRTDVLTRVRFETGQVLGQLRVREPSTDGSGFSANPYDLVHVSASGPKAWVTRFGVGSPTSASEPNLGNDLLEIDAETMALTGARADLSAFNLEVSPAESGLPRSTLVYARPSLVTTAGGVVVVGLARLSADFDAAAEGVVIAFDPASGRIHGLALPGLENCGRVTLVPRSPSTHSAPPSVLVSCTGFAWPYGDELAARQSAGLAVVSVRDGRLSLERIWRAADHPSAPVAVSGAISLSDTLVLATATGNLSSGSPPDFDTGRPDRFCALDLDAEMVTPIFETRRAFEIGVPSFDIETGLVLVPDASEGVRRYELRGTELHALEPLPLGVSEGLPPREILLLAE